MFRKYMIFILAAFMVLGTSACTSKKASDDSADVEQSAGDESIEAAEATGNNDDLAMDTSGDSGATADLGGVSDDLAPEEKLPDDKAAAAGDTVSADAAAPTDMGDTPPPPADQAATEPLPPPEPGADTGAPPMAADSAAPAEPMAPPAPEPAGMTESKPVATLQKMKTTPEKHGKILANALYVARKGDSPESISQKVFGSKDKVKDLCKVNSYNCSRPVKVGDKFYYQSPQRPTDDAVVKTFYEDAGIAPQFYTAKAGDNIRKVGKELLGHERSWQELWATNEVESKGDLEEGTKLRYWPDTDAAPAQTMAKTEDAGAPPGEAAQGEAPPDGAAPAPDQAATPPPPPPDAQAAQPPPPPPPAADALPPAPPDQAAAAGSVEPPAPPPPPPPDQAAGHKEPAAIDGGAQDPNQTMALGVGAVLLLAAAALFISIRKKRARRQIDFNTTTQTQIE
ncbi:MAG: LysM peptidoglycan-binding domain-containing protein [Bdellovibrionales bacterium]